MTRLAIVAVGGESRRTGLGEYTTKAALPLRGRSLLAHQIAFAREKFRVDRVLVVCRSRHARLLGERLSPEERARTAFVLYDGPPVGWAGTVEQAMPHVDTEDEVLLISCDNLHTAEEVHALGYRPALFTYTRWDRLDKGPTDGPILARSPTVWGEGADAWVPRSGTGYTGDLFTGYVVARGAILHEALAGIILDSGQKEFTALLAALSRFPGYRALPYGGTYEDVADLAALARLGAGKRAQGDDRVTVGAGVLLHDGRGHVFLTERQDGRGWVPPGGIVDVGETYTHAAAREFREEAGIGIPEADFRLLGIYPTIGKDGELAVSVMFHAQWCGLSLESPWFITNSAEVRRFGWFSLDKTRALVIPFDLRDAVEDYFAGRELDAR